METIRQFAQENYIPIIKLQTEKLLVDLIKNCNPNSILEIGTAIGYSGLIMLNNCQALLTTVDIDEQRLQLAKENFIKFGYNERVKIICDDAIAVLPNLDFKYDFIFLDGAKSQYNLYLPYLLNNLADDGTMLCDNLAFGNRVLSNDLTRKHRTIVKNLQKFITTVTTDANLMTQFLPDIGDGVAIIKKI